MTGRYVVCVDGERRLVGAGDPAALIFRALAGLRPPHPRHGTRWVRVEVADEASGEAVLRRDVPIPPPMPPCPQAENGRHRWQVPPHWAGTVPPRLIRFAGTVHRGGVLLREACARCGLQRLTEARLGDGFQAPRWVEIVRYVPPPLPQPGKRRRRRRKPAGT